MLDVEGRHVAVREFGDRFETGHLAPGLPREVMGIYRDAAERLLSALPDCPQLARALDDLWHSKNEAVLQAVRIQRGRDGGEA